MGTDVLISSPATGVSASAERPDPQTLYRLLRLPRTIEEKMLRLIRQNRIAKWFSGFGQEAIAVGCAFALRADDTILPMHRNLGVWTTRGLPLEPLFRQLMGKEGGYTRGRDRTFHFGLPERHIVGMISHLGAMLPVACGVGLAARLAGNDRVALGLVGEGATREGDFHEALNLASVWKLPVIFVVENNGYGLSTPSSHTLPVENVADAAAGYGMTGEIVDGNDLLSVIDAVRRAADRARSGNGPTLLEMKTFRMRGHEEASGTKYVPPHLFEAWAQKDPVERLRRVLVDRGEITTEEIAAIDKELAAAVHVAAETALAAEEVTGDAETEATDVYAPSHPVPRPAQGPESEKRFLDAIHDGLHQAMEEDPSVLVLGQDVAEYGGVFKVTAGLLERFGKDRVRNTPIVESGAIGAAMGLALEGFKPVVEMQYMDFISCGFNQVVNNLATTHYRWGAPVNVTIRGPFGGYIGAGPFHSQSPEAWFCHVPGLKVVVPATPRDAKGLLRSAIDDPNPVLFFEHKYLYRALRGMVPDASYATPLGEGRIAARGVDATVVTWGIGVLWALEEVAHWARSGVQLEVIDLRTLVPWDRPLVLESVRKTSRLLVLHEAPRRSGFGAEIAAQIVEEAFEELDAPPLRIAAENWPIPFSTHLEKQLYSARARLRGGLERLLAY